jgi:2'-5' RNA ligase
MAIESALIIAVPEAESLVKAWRERFDWSAAQGVPAHITILYPFMPPQEITPEVLEQLRDLFAQFSAFEFTLPEIRHFPAVLYLAPSPAEPFKALTQAVVERYPDYPPYGGEFAVSELTPHLTIADRLEAAQLNNIEREFMQQHGVQLPVKAKASEVVLIENASGGWETREVFVLAA